MSQLAKRSIDEAPVELADAVREFWPATEWDNAVSVAFLESGWNAFAENDTTDDAHPCGALFGTADGIAITAEHSVGWFQINVCNFPSWQWGRLFNTRHNAGTAHMLWAFRGWEPWLFSARQLGLL